VKVGNNGRNDLYIVDADGQNRIRLTDTPEEEGIPAWSPDGATIAISIPTEGDAEIFLLDAETGAVVGQLTDNEGFDDYMPAWSPDGSQIAYVVRDSNGGTDQVYLMGSDGTGSIRLTDDEASSYYPAWSPDGKVIAFVSSLEDDQVLFTMNADGSDRHQLSDGVDRDSRPAWSPDGTTIAYHTSLDDSWSIELIEVATGRVSLLVADGVHPAWSRPTG